MSATAALGFVHRFVPERSSRTLLLLHGTGGDEADLLPLGHALDPHAALLSPRGQVSENGMPRFFRRLADGVFDEADLIARTHELAEFITRAATHYGLNSREIIAVGYSNGANIASSLLLLHPSAIRGAALMRPMVPLVPDELPDLHNAPVLIAAGNQDPVVSANHPRNLESLLRGAGADVIVYFENAGHGLTDMTVDVVRQWLTKIA